LRDRLEFSLREDGTCVAKAWVMSQINQLMAILAVAFATSVALMWNVERDSIKGRPQHPHTLQTHAVQAQVSQPQPARI
jgi:hypothetical protein